MCSNTAAITVSVLPKPNIGANPGYTAVCFGQSLSISGTGGVTYTWTGGITNGVPFTATASNIYFMTGTGANGCTDTSFSQVDVYQTTVAINASTTSICAGIPLILNFTGATNYSLNGSAVSSSVSVSPSVTTTYTLVGSGAMNCTGSQTITINVISCSGLKEYSTLESDYLSAYPNPSNGTFNLRSTRDEAVNILNELGQLIKKVQLPSNTEVKITGLDKGIYFVISPRSRLKIIVN
jgi:hypothetical protein